MNILLKCLLRFFLTLVLAVACVSVAVFILFLVVHRDRRPQIYFAVERGDTNAIAKYLALGSNVNTAILSYPYGGNRDVPLLDIAVVNGQLETVEFLLKNGANPNQPDYLGEAPLQWAIGRIKNDVPVEKRTKILKTLIESGAEPNRKNSNQYGYTPLIRAAEFGELEMARILLTAGADVNATNNDGQTALHFADNPEIARFLMAAGADRNARTVTGETPADSALADGRFSVLNALTNTATPKP